MITDSGGNPLPASAGVAPDARGAKLRTEDRSVSSRALALPPDPLPSPELATPINSPDRGSLLRAHARRLRVVLPDLGRLLVNARLNPLVPIGAYAAAALSNPQWTSDIWSGGAGLRIPQCHVARRSS